MSSAIIIQGIDVPIRLRNPSNAIAPPILSVLVLIQIISQMKDVVHGVLPRRIAVCVEKSERIVAAGVYGKANLGDQITGRGGCLCPTNGTFIVGIADVELEIVLGVGPEFLRFHL